MLGIDTSTIVEFERNDYEVLPIISSRLKLQGRKWRIYHEQEFFQTIENLKSGDIGKKEDESVGIFYLKKDLSPLLSIKADFRMVVLPASVETCPLITQLVRQPTLRSLGSASCDIIAFSVAGDNRFIFFLI